MKIAYCILVLSLLFGTFVSHVQAVSPIPGHRFAFLNHFQREFTEEESQYIATHYDLAVIGLQTGPMITSGKRIKEINPNIKLFVYFPTSIRHKGARYGQDVFKESWYLHDFSGNRILKGQTVSLEWVDLTQADYIDWARQTILGFLPQVPYDGAVYDNAGPIGVVNDSWLDVLTQEKLNAWNTSQLQYLRNMTTNLNSRNKILIYNGIHRAPSKINRTLSYLDITNGTLNENFCYGQDPSINYDYRVVAKEYQLEDIDLQLSIGNQQKFVLQKINWEGNLSTLPATEQKRLGNYCYGIFLMGHVPGYTFFKFGDGYSLSLRPQEYRVNAETIDLPLGNPTASYHKSDWLLSRRFQNGYVVVNLDTTSATWTAPQRLKKFVSQSNYQQITQNQQIAIAPQTAMYFLLPNTLVENPADLNNDGHVNLTDFNRLLSGYGTTYGLSHFNQLLANYGD